MKKSLLWIIAFSVSLVFSQMTLAHGDGRCGEGMKKMLESLKLDDSQKSKIKPILEQLRSSVQASASQLKGLHAQVNQQIQSDSMDQAALDGLMDKKIKLIGDIMKAKMNAKHQIYVLLNAQQKANYQTMTKKLEEKMEARYQKCHSDND